MTADSVVVAGAGLAGLVAARHLADAGFDVTVYEQEPVVGGRVRTTSRDGFQFDEGFQVLFTAYPAARRELDFEALDLCEFRSGVWIARPGRRSVLADPVKDRKAAFESLTNREVTFRDKHRLLQFKRRLAAGPDETDDESTRQYLKRHGFSTQFITRFAEPFFGEITLDRSLETSSWVAEHAFASISNGSAAVPAAGMSAIPAQLARFARDAGATIETGRVVDAVSARDHAAVVSVDDEWVTTDVVVVATDPKTAKALTGVDSIPTAGVGYTTQYYRLPADKSLETSGRLILNGASSAPNTVAELSAVAPSYTPVESVLLAATFLGDDADASNDELAFSTRRALESWYPEYAFDDLETVYTARVPFSQFSQPPGFRDALPSVRTPEGPVYLAGAYTEWSSMQGALTSGWNAARAMIEDRS